ncbi:DNA-binding response regulator [Parvularcula bermudensis HTCC2503]|uniref:DNA-binding response regulator n=1 Tax=Parvularcula bermudensis (strain ATCC BAA-594 / HTCC2503 / KCTC 12087) TaxID=314260 RepID=E0TCV1_PARBH|nr:response regulator transcription factor [Parvularcula bermudensis]ADM09890.1 DNA-binding response regulator [Parvularcula bermudensis HTCC2503]
MTQPRRVLIVDDHPLFRDALQFALERTGHDNVTAIQAGSLAEAFSIIGPTSESEQTDLILLDLNMSDTEGFDGLTRLLSAARTARVAVVSATETAEAFATAKTLGASAYLPKSLPLPQLTEALTLLLEGQEWYPTATQAADDVSAAARNLAQLTPAQRRVLNGLAAGLLNKQIAYEMGISDATVKAHMTAIMRKLGATNRTQALLLYREAVAL